MQHLLLTRPQPLSASALIDPLGTVRRARRAAEREGSGSEGMADDGMGHPEADAGAEPAAAEGTHEGAHDDAPSESTPSAVGFDTAWCEAARAWNSRARGVIAEMVGEIARSLCFRADFFTPSQRGLSDGAASDKATFDRTDVTSLAPWATEGGAEGWLAALSSVDALPRAQRAQRYLLPGYGAIYSATRGVPGAVATLAGGLAVHYSVKPRWPELVAIGLGTRQVTSSPL